MKTNANQDRNHNIHICHILYEEVLIEKIYKKWRRREKEIFHLERNYLH